MTGNRAKSTFAHLQNRVSGNNRRISADLDIVVPKGATIEAHGRSGDFDISGITGSVDINSDNASVRLEDIGGDVEVEDARQRHRSRSQN